MLPQRKHVEPSTRYISPPDVLRVWLRDLLERTGRAAPTPRQLDIQADVELFYAGDLNLSLPSNRLDCWHSQGEPGRSVASYAPCSRVGSSWRCCHVRLGARHRWRGASKRNGQQR